MEITLIRHLPTEWNRKQKLQGKKDIPLLPISEKERIEINKNLEIINTQSYDYVLSSNLIRTKQTADLYGFTPTPEPLLNELDFGPFEGKSKEELLQKHGVQWIENPVILNLGESVLNLENRINLFLDKYKEASSILAFGHGSWIRACKSYFKYGHINHMNKIIVRNNECISLEFISVEA